MTATKMILGIALTATLGLACAQIGVAPSSRFKIVDRFPDRVGELEVLGIEVKSALPDGSIPEADLEKLAGFISDDLRGARGGRGGSFAAVVNLNAGGKADKVGLILTIDINLLRAATPEERKKRVASHLHGTISLRNRVTGKHLGTAAIWATGSGLDLEPTYPPKTVAEFTDAIREIVH